MEPINANISFLQKKWPDKSQKRMLLTLHFISRLALLSVPLYLIIGFGISLLPLQIAVAGHSGWLLSSTGYGVSIEGATLTVGSADMPSFQFFINEDCTGWKSMLLLFAMMFAFPAVATGKRLWGILLGIPLLWLVNIVRVAGVVLVERAYGLPAALAFHDYGWQVGLMAAVLGIWAVWLFWARNEGMPGLWQQLWRRAG